MIATAPARSITEARPAMGVADFAVTLAVAAASAALVLALSAGGPHGAGPAGSDDLDLVGALVGIVVAAPLVVWRRAPFAVFTVTALLAAGSAAIGHPLRFPVAATVALYLLAATRDERSPWRPGMTLTVLGLLGAYVAATGFADMAFPATELSHTSLAWAAAWFAGERSRLRRAQLAELHDRAARAEGDAERERRLAVAEERARIARDLHDSAGHAVNVIAVRAGAARLRHPQEPDRSIDALGAIEELARQTVEDIDRIVGTLRTRSGEPVHGFAPSGLSSLKDLIATHEAAGLDVRYDSVGAPMPLDAAADLAAYRIVQEALSNAARHGAGIAYLTVCFGGTAVELTISNPVPAESASRSGGGHGLVGMRERAALMNGTLTIERSDRHFQLQATIPYRGGKP